ncbi:MAG TPA: hemolysin family protein [Bacteroidales bacterium]
MNLLWFVVISLLFTFIFAGIEIAFASLNKMQVELKIKQGGLMGSLFTILFRNAAFFNVMASLGYYFSLAVFAISAVDILHPFIYRVITTPFWFLVVEVFLVALIILFIAELFARTVGSSKSNLFLRIFLIPAVFIFVMVYPLSWALISLARFFVALLTSGRYRSVMPLFKKFDFIQWAIEINSKQKEESQYNQELKIFQKALVFSQVRIRDCMIPRTEIEAIPVNARMEDLRKKFISTGYSKIIVYRNTVDNIVGYVNSKELFKHPSTIKEKLNPVAFVPETMPASKLLHEFMQYHRSVAVVVDEYGGTSGLVTLEDIMEEIFGEIEDEHDTDDLLERQIKPNEYVFSSRLEIEYLNSKYGLKFPESEHYDTLAGFILFHHQNLPKPNTVIEIDNYTFKILRVSNTRIELVHLDVNDK